MLPPAHPLEEPLARSALQMLDEHRALCPLDGLALEEKVLTQHRITAYVPELDVVVLAVPDLLHTRRGRWIWRETKTSAAPCGKVARCCAPIRNLPWRFCSSTRGPWAMGHAVAVSSWSTCARLRGRAASKPSILAAPPRWPRPVR